MRNAKMVKFSIIDKPMYLDKLTMRRRKRTNPLYRELLHTLDTMELGKCITISVANLPTKKFVYFANYLKTKARKGGRGFHIEAAISNDKTTGFIWKKEVEVSQE